MFSNTAERLNVPGGADLLPPPSFRIEGGESLGAGLRRVSVGQLDHALAALTELPTDLGIHEARKAMRRVRALLRLVRDVGGRRILHAENLQLRDSGRKIGGSRDATVMVHTIDGVSLLYGSALRRGVFDHLRRQLVERDLAVQKATQGSVFEVVDELELVRNRFEVLSGPPGPTIASQFGSVERGLRRVYRQGQRLMADAYLERTSEAFHEWRKRVRYLRFQMEVLKGMWPLLQRGHTKDLSELAETLGAEHDLAMLRLLMRDEPEMLPHQPAQDLLGALLERNQFRLQMAARPLADRVYADSPDQFVRRLHASWDAWRP